MRILFIILILVAFALPSPSANASQHRSLPIQVESVESLLTIPFYNNRRVIVTGVVEGYIYLMGIRGGNYHLTMIEGGLVLSFPNVIAVRVGHTIVIQGRYVRRGRIGGYYYDNIIYDPLIY